MAQNGTISKEISSKQSTFIDALLVGSTVVVAAKTACISPRTAARWRKEQVILAELQQRRRAQFNEALEDFRAGLPTAIAFVRETITNEDVPYAVRLRAATCWIEQALEIHKMEELEARLAALEERLK